MAPRSASRKSTPSYSNGTKITPSRRSSRVPGTPKVDSTRSSKSMDLPSSPSSQDIRFYYPKTPPSSKPLPNSSPEQPSTRRRMFQARPSRLSNVYTPVTETPDSSSQDSRRTRRMAALGTPNDVSFDKDVESMGSTGWTYDQYMGRLEGSNDPPSPSAASSKGTRSSARLRKPTTRAIEALELKKSPRRKNTDHHRASDRVHALTLTEYPASAVTEASDTLPPNPTNDSMSSATSTMHSVRASNQDDTGEPAAPGLKKSTRRPLKGKKSQKATKPHKAQLLRIELDLDTAGRNIYNAGLEAFSEDFKLPSDPVWFINNARFAYFQSKSGVRRTRRALAGDEHQPNLYDSATDSATDSGGTRGFQKSAPPRVESDGWSHLGRINNIGEELVIPPADHSLYRAPHTYGDGGLPYPPVRSRSEVQAGKDNSLGFPPLIGDRNIPFDVRSQFEAEDVTEEQKRADEARQRAAEAPVRTRKPRAAKRRQSAPASNVDISAPAENEEQESVSKPKRRRRNARVSLPTTTVTPAAPTTPKPAATAKTPKSKATKSTAKNSAAAATPVSSAIAPAAKDNEDTPRGFIRLKLNAPKPEGQFHTPTGANTPQAAETPRTAKGKKRTANSIDSDELSSTKGVKRARMAPDGDLESTPKSVKRNLTTKMPSASMVPEQGDEVVSQNELTSGKVSTPKAETNNRPSKGPRRSASVPASRARGRGRGRGRG